MQKKVNLQDLFLLRAREDRLNVTVFFDERFSDARHYHGV